jgi:hypothetical protein
VPIERLTDGQLYAVGAGGLPDSDTMPKALPPPCKFRETNPTRTPWPEKITLGMGSQS